MGTPVAPVATLGTTTALGGVTIMTLTGLLRAVTLAMAPSLTEAATLLSLFVSTLSACAAILTGWVAIRELKRRRNGHTRRRT